MKTKLFMTMAASVLLFSACSNDDQEVDNGPVELRVSSGVEVLQTRAAANTQENAIAVDEIVSLWVDNAAGGSIYKAIQLTADGGTGFTGGTAMYFPPTVNAVNIYALHGTFSPAFTAGSGFPSVLGVEFTLPVNQTPTAATPYTKYDLLYAYSKDVARNGNPTTANLTFYHILSKLELAIKIEAGVPALESFGVTLGDANIIMNGTFTPSTSADITQQANRAAMLTAGSSKSKLMLGQLTSIDFSAANVIYNEALVFPQDMAGKELIFELTTGEKLKYTIPAGTTFESGKKYRYHITLTRSGLTVTSSIADWEAVNAIEGTAEM